MKNKDAKQGNKRDMTSKAVPLVVLLILLCGFSFYLGGIFYSGKNSFFSTILLPKTVFQKETVSVSLKNKPVLFPDCGIAFQDYTPCTDPKRWRKFGNYRLSFMERHCPPISERKECLVPPPKGYKIPIRWPQSKDECWYRNVPYDWINNQKSNQHWLKKDGDKFLFPGGGTMFPNGVSKYVDLMENLIPEMKDGTVRTAIDTGCGVRLLRELSKP